VHSVHSVSAGAQLLFPITYIFGDIFTEVYGYGGSRRIIWIGFLASGLMAALGVLAIKLPPAPEWQISRLSPLFLGSFHA